MKGCHVGQEQLWRQRRLSWPRRCGEWECLPAVFPSAPVLYIKKPPLASLWQPPKLAAPATFPCPVGTTLACSIRPAVNRADSCSLSAKTGWHHQEAHLGAEWVCIYLLPRASFVHLKIISAKILISKWVRAATPAHVIKSAKHWLFFNWEYLYQRVQNNLRMQ